MPRKEPPHWAHLAGAPRCSVELIEVLGLATGVELDGASLIRSCRLRAAATRSSYASFSAWDVGVRDVLAGSVLRGVAVGAQVFEPGDGEVVPPAPSEERGRFRVVLPLEGGQGAEAEAERVGGVHVAVAGDGRESQVLPKTLLSSAGTALVPRGGT